MPVPESRAYPPDLDGFLLALTENPDLARRSAQELGRRFHIAPELVAEVQEILTVHRQSEGFQSIPSRVRQLLAYLGGGIRWLWLEFAKWPFGSMAAVFLLLILCLRTIGNQSGDPSHLEWTAWVLSTGLISSILSLNRRIRYPLIGALCFGGILAWHEVDATVARTSPVLAAEAGLKVLASSALFFAVTGVWAVWEWLSRAIFVEDPVAGLGRQQMISRLVQLQKLALEKSPQPAKPHVLHTRWAEMVRSLSLLVGFGGGFLMRSVVQSEIALGGPGVSLALIPIGAAVVGFFSVEPAIALLASVLFAIGFGASDLIGLTASLPVGLVNPIGLWLLSGLGGLAGSIAAQGTRGKHVRELHALGNTASTIAEVVRIQWKMAAVPSNVCVMAVDVAGSTQMKQGANALLAEFSFREYQRFISEISERNGGRVHSTAGDGVVAAFDSCRRAAAAAREIQRGLFRFNNESNRLRSPFRLRIGLHVDSVPGDLRDVQFSRVIDVAAHVEGVSPVGGVAITDSVAKRLPGEAFEPTLHVVDGFEVFVLPLVEAA